MGTEGLPVADRIWREKPSPQNLRNIFLLDRLYTLFLLAAENGIKLVRKFFAEGIALGWIGREQRRNDGSIPILPRANIRTSSMSRSVARSSLLGKASNSTIRFSAGALSRSSALPSACRS